MDRSTYIGAISDHYKSAYGIRPRHIDFDSMSDQELLDAEALYYKEACEAWEEEKARMADSARRFEELLLGVIELGAANRATALRWLVDASLPEMFCYDYNLPAEYEEEVSALLV